MIFSIVVAFFIFDNVILGIPHLIVHCQDVLWRCSLSLNSFMYHPISLEYLILNVHYQFLNTIPRYCAFTVCLVGYFCIFLWGNFVLLFFSLNVKMQLPHIMIKIILLSREPLERNWLVDVSAEDLKAMIHQKVKGRSMCRRPKDRKSRYW